ncbi:hypothetical protein AB0K52_22885 [Glycomyces sp. NPDC049804]|uniref:hypothetical protein n=1 Tax=Glycomyces sp. NPDC049804 TaxID=3154363 RepID=UPI00344AE169
MVLVQEPFYRHETLGPGAPLRTITGSSDQAGYYDWAGRRLFLADGEPDPMCPGAYRYQHNPASCDEEAPDSDPRSPRYEPMHLRHRPGDTWIIDTNRPYDPYDPGPYGSPGWYKDERTGRHRRDETPDPLPAEDWIPPANAWFPGTADWPEPMAAQEKTATTTERRSGDHDGEHSRFRGERGGSDRPPPWGQRGRPVPSEPEEPEQHQAGPRRSRFWPDDDEDPRGGRYRLSEDHGWTSGACTTPTEHDHRQPEYTETHRFSKLREDAFDRFIANSAQLRAAHFAPQKPYLRERAAWVLHWLAWVLTCGLIAMPAPLKRQQGHPEPPAARPIPAQPGPGTHEPEAVRAGVVLPANDFRGGATPTAARQPVEANTSPRPGAAIAAAISGARAARRVIAARQNRTEHDLARAVRNSATRRPSPRPYMATWEHAFDTNATFIIGGGIA